VRTTLGEACVEGGADSDLSPTRVRREEGDDRWGPPVGGYGRGRGAVGWWRVMGRLGRSLRCAGLQLLLGRLAGLGGFSWAEKREWLRIEA
jgi:hypothetical protein